MRRILPTTLSLLALATVIGCANPATSKLVAAPAAEPAAPAVAEVQDLEAQAARPTVTVRTGTLADAPKPPAEDEALAEAPMIDADKLAAEPPRRSAATGQAGAQNILDPWRPYGLGVAAKTANSVTLAWRTDLDSKAIIYYGKSFGLSWNGYEGVYHENNSSKFHTVTITGLSRFRSYTFTVIGMGALGMQFPTYPFKARTNLF